jgi:DNA-binding HxlR family transcriptional regulator
VVRELIAGSTRFNDLRRGLPKMSPALLSQRLKELEAAEIVRRAPAPSDPSILEYQLTPRGRALQPLVEGFGLWGQRWIETEVSLQNLDATLLMWDMRRNIDATPLPSRRSVIQFRYPELPPTQRSWWILTEPETGPDLCSIDPGFDVDLYVVTDLRTMTAVWMGYESLRSALAAERMTVTGDRALADSMDRWLGLSVFARDRKLAS